MKSQLLPIVDVLFVFDSWTLMMQSDLASYLCPDDEIYLFDENKNRLGRAKLSRFLLSKNPNISPIVINMRDNNIEMKKIKFIMLIK